ncbi:hypothetical protein CCR75_000910 [Bremia lactucae]|uniref:Uncharacterized protein n=1 Tax=Bremia lactucae TaxID=4779 RepID=A0A976IED2_BRELC|nr:hypothetical protein CCR75_000910 [Bremia lactucae]
MPLAALRASMYNSSWLQKITMGSSESIERAPHNWSFYATDHCTFRHWQPDKFTNITNLRSDDSSADRLKIHKELDS